MDAQHLCIDVAFVTAAAALHDLGPMPLLCCDWATSATESPYQVHAAAVYIQMYRIQY
jgi:hypothetical protein